MDCDPILGPCSASRYEKLVSSSHAGNPGLGANPIPNLHSDHLLKYLIAVGAATVLAWLFTRVLIPALSALGFVDQPGERRIHEWPTPIGGGVAVFAAFHLTCALLYFVLWPNTTGQLDQAWWWAFLASSSLLLVVGLIDDRVDLSPIAKLTGQVAAAALLITLSGRGLTNLLGWELPLWLDVILSIFWCVALINAFNLIDGLDGLCAGLAYFSALGCGIAYLMNGAPGDAIVSLILSGAALGFLRYNFSPARIFLGDTGSMFLGFTLAAMAMQTTGKQTLIVSIGVPLLAAGVPLMDTLLAIWRRSIRKALAQLEGTTAPGITKADREHLHHRLLKLGLTQKQVAWSLYGLNGLFVVIGLLSIFYSTLSVGLLLLAFVALVYVVVRHVVHVELWDTGRFITQGLRRPSRNLARMIFYPVADLVWMGLSVIAANLLLRFDEVSQWSNQEWLQEVTIWVSPTFVTLVLAKTYKRIWPKATFRDYSRLFLALFTGGVLATGLQYAIYPQADLEPIATGCLFLFISQLAIFGVRSFSQMLREAMILSAGRQSREELTSRRILLYGAGERGNLYLRELRIVQPEVLRQMQIVGFLDDNPILKNCYTQGVRVLGTVAQLEALAEKHAINEVIVTTQLAPENQERLLKTAARLGLSVRRYYTGTEPLEAPDNPVRAERLSTLE